MVMPGDNTEMVVELIQPIAMEEGLRFAIREGGRTVGAGQVLKAARSCCPDRQGRHAPYGRDREPPAAAHTARAPDKAVTRYGPGPPGRPPFGAAARIAGPRDTSTGTR
jgi:hypothetical protein